MVGRKRLPTLALSVAAIVALGSVGTRADGSSSAQEAAKGPRQERRSAGTVRIATTSPLDNGDIVEVSLVRSPDLRIEHFRLDRVEWGSELPAPGDVGGAGWNGDGPLGLVQWSSGTDGLGFGSPRSGDESFGNKSFGNRSFGNRSFGNRSFGDTGFGDGPERRIEQATTFFDVDTRVIHTESLRPEERRLVYREVRERAGRTVLVEWPLGEELRSADTVGRAVVRREHDFATGAFFPLYLVEAARRGESFEGEFEVFQPLANRLEPLRIRLERSAEGHTLSLWRPDGRLAGRYRFQGDRLVAFQWQAGGPVARAISRERYAELLAERDATEEAEGASEEGEEPRAGAGPPGAGLDGDRDGDGEAG